MHFYELKVNFKSEGHPEVFLEQLPKSCQVHRSQMQVTPATNSDIIFKKNYKSLLGSDVHLLKASNSTNKIPNDL